MEPPSPDPPSPTRRVSGNHVPWEAPSIERLSDLLPAYEILRLIGCGGMGAVYEAFQKSLQRKVAIKVLPDGAGTDEFQFADRFRNEAFSMAKLSHPGIVNVIDAGECSDGLLYFVMEYVEGRDLAQELEARDRFSETETLSIFTQLAEALGYAHANGIVHRDIKPANVLLDPRGRVKIADFGLAKLTGGDDSWRLTRTGTTMGTPDYIAPELRKAGGIADARSDLFSLGVICYQMLTGDLPRGMFKLPTEQVPGLAEGWDRVICKALEPKPEDRYEDAASILRDLTEGEKSSPDSIKKVPATRIKGLAIFLPLGVILTLTALILTLSRRPPSQPPAIVEDSKFDLDALRKEMAAVDVETKWALLKTKIDELNGSDVTIFKKDEDKNRKRITYLGINHQGKAIKDIRPVAAIPELLELSLHDLWLEDISCLSGMRIERLGIFQSNLTDLSVFETLPSLWALSLTNAKRIEDFTPLGHLKLTLLDLNTNPQLKDISFVRGLPLTHLNIRDTGVRDLSPLTGMKIQDLEYNADIPFTAELLRSLPNLEKINRKPVEEWMKIAGSATVESRPGNIIDLTPLIDVTRDVIAGEWRIADGGLVVSPSGEIPSHGFPRLELPYAPSGDYDFEVEFEVAGDGSGVYQILSAQDRSFSWTAGVKLAASYKAGFDRIEGQSVMDRQDGTVMRPVDFLKAGQRHLLKVAVRATTVRGFLDGEPLVHWGTSAESFQSLDLSPRLTLRTSGRLGLAVDNRAVTFHRIVVREVTTTNLSISAETPSAAVVWSDWLTPKLADTKTFVGKDWKREPAGVTTGLILAGTFIFPEPVTDLAVRARYEMRDSNGIQITMRERGSGGLRELYVAHDNGRSLYIGRMLPSEREIRVEKLVEHRLPDGFVQKGDRVLEFRCEGKRLIATVNGTETIIAEDTTLTKGAAAIVVSKGALLKGVEVDRPSPHPASSSTK